MERELPEKTLISIVAPLFNEEKNVPPFVYRLDQVFKRLGYNWELVFAMDPCTDRTQEVTVGLLEQGYPIRLLKFSRRIGKPLSVIAGLDHTRGHASVVMDVDLQDPPELIEEMIRKWREGYDVVIAQRVSREGEHPLYLKAAELYYKILAKISDVDVPRNAGDYRLLDARVVEEMRHFREHHGFLRGITASVGFPTALVPFHRDARLTGRTQISLRGAVNIAIDGIVPFSRVPIRSIFVLGAVMTLSATAGVFLWFFAGLFQGFSDQWPVMLLCFLLPVLHGITLVCLGIVGEYVLRTYEEARGRPLYVVERIYEAGSAGGRGTDSGVVSCRNQ